MFNHEGHNREVNEVTEIIREETKLKAKFRGYISFQSIYYNVQMNQLPITYQLSQHLLVISIK